jgi:hypothetical protein
MLPSMLIAVAVGIGRVRGRTWIAVLILLADTHPVDVPGEQRHRSSLRFQRALTRGITAGAVTS